jgi:hypothetical protein
MATRRPALVRGGRCPLSRKEQMALSQRDGRDLWRFAHASNP